MKISNGMKTNVGKIKKEIKRALNVFWKNLFLVLIFFIVIDLFLGLGFFYLYYLKPQTEEPVLPLALTVNQTLLQDVFSKWDEKELRHQQITTKEFPNFFREAALQVSPTEATSSEATTTPQE